MKSWNANLWIYLQPAPDVEGAWVAHCLDLDVVTQGDSLKHAVEMVFEAVAMTVMHEMLDGRDPDDLPRAPEEYWEELREVQKHGDAGDLGGMLLGEGRDVRCAALQIAVAFEVRSVETTIRPDIKPLPAVWSTGGGGVACGA